MDVAHANRPCRNQRGCGSRGPIEALRDRARRARPPGFRRGNNRASARGPGRRATIPWRCAPGLRHARRRACTRRQRKRTGGPSGTSAIGFDRFRPLEQADRARRDEAVLCECRARRHCDASGCGRMRRHRARANSGICVSCGTSRVHARGAEARAAAGRSDARARARVIAAGKPGLRRIAALGRRAPRAAPCRSRSRDRPRRRAPPGGRRTAARCARDRAAARRCRARCDAPCRRCGTARPADSRAPSPRRSSTRAKFAREMLDGAEHVVLARDRLGEALLGQRGRHRQARRDRLVLAAERLVDAAHERLRRSARRAARAAGR